MSRFSWAAGDLADVEIRHALRFSGVFMAAVHPVGVLVALVLATGPAQPHKPDCDCTTACMYQSALARYEKADVELNATYKQLMTQLDEEGKKSLRNAQRAWIAFRDAEAETLIDECGVRGGTNSVLIHTSTMQRLTEERTARLKKWLDGLEPEKKPATTQGK